MTIIELKEKALDIFTHTLLTHNIEEMNELHKQAENIINIANNALETGYWQGEALAAIREAKATAYEAIEQIENTMLNFWGIRA